MQFMNEMRHLSPRELGLLGMADVAYIKPVVGAGTEPVAVHAAARTEMAGIPSQIQTTSRTAVMSPGARSSRAAKAFDRGVFSGNRFNMGHIPHLCPRQTAVRAHPSLRDNTRNGRLVLLGPELRPPVAFG